MAPKRSGHSIFGTHSQQGIFYDQRRIAFVRTAAALLATGMTFITFSSPLEAETAMPDYRASSRNEH
jgi:hypothetical protein